MLPLIKKGVFSKSILILSGIAWVMMFCIVSGVLAQSLKNESGSAVSKTEDTSLATIVVTAQKRDEDAQKVPISMSVLPEMEISDAGMKDLKDLTLFTPNVYAKQSVNQNMLIIRGVSSHNVVLNTPAGLFVDGINYPMTFMQNPNLVDIERVEVLRGPQGTLYGRNTLSGAVNIITKQPGNDFTGKVFVEPSFYDVPGSNPFKYRGGISLSGPAVENTLYWGGAFQMEKSDGYVENIYDGDDEVAKVEHLNGQGKLRWTPNETLSINLLVNGFKSDDGYGYTRYIDGVSASDPFEINWNGTNNHWKDDHNGQALDVSWTGKTFNITSITTRNDFDTDFIYDGEHGALNYPDQYWRFDNVAYSQELRFSSVDDKSPLEWIVGVFGYREEWDAHAEYFGSVIKTDWGTKGYAIFGQTTYTVLEKLHLTGGLRFDSMTSDGGQNNSNVAGRYEADIDHNEFLPKVSASYDVTSNAICYATVSRGMMAGGYDYAFATSSDTLTFDPEYSWNYELGLKMTWFGGKLKANAAVYHIDIKDKQVQEWLSDPAVRKTTNAAEASSTGFELEVEARPFEGWRFFGGFGYSDSKIDDWVSDEMSGGTYDYSGKQMPYAPDYTFNAGAQYMHHTGFFGRVDFMGVGQFFTNAKEEDSGKVDSYELVNMKVGYDSESYQIALWAKNVLGEDYILQKTYYIGGHTVQDGEGRSVGVTLTYRF